MQQTISLKNMDTGKMETFTADAQGVIRIPNGMWGTDKTLHLAETTTMITVNDETDVLRGVDVLGDDGSTTPTA